MQLLLFQHFHPPDLYYKQEVIETANVCAAIQHASMHTTEVTTSHHALFQALEN